MGEKVKAQLPAELLELQKAAASEGLFSQIIDHLPFPIAVFTAGGELAAVNSAFEAATKIRSRDLAKGAYRIFSHNTEDIRLAQAVRQVFAGKTSYLEALKNPLSLFFDSTRQDAPQPGGFDKAVVFPVPADDGEVLYGVIAFI